MEGASMAKKASGDRDAPQEWKEQVLIDLSRQTATAFDVTNDEEAAGGMTATISTTSRSKSTTTLLRRRRRSFPISPA